MDDTMPSSPQNRRPTQPTGISEKAAPMDDLVERLRDESARLSGRSLDRGCVDSGIAANLAAAAADEIERLSALTASPASTSALDEKERTNEALHRELDDMTERCRPAEQRVRDSLSPASTGPVGRVLQIGGRYGAPIWILEGTETQWTWRKTSAEEIEIMRAALNRRPSLLQSVRDEVARLVEKGMTEFNTYWPSSAGTASASKAYFKIADAILSLLQSVAVPAVQCHEGDAQAVPLVRSGEVTDEMCRRAIDAIDEDRFQGFSTAHDSPNGRNRTWGAPHFVRDVSLKDEPIVWRGDSHDEMLKRIKIEEMRLALAATMTAPETPLSREPIAPAVQEWRCAARKQALPEPADCNWPFCGCDPQATKVIEALEETGWSPPDPKNAGTA